MKLLTTTGLAFVLSAAPLLAQSSIDEVKAQLAAQGYGNFEVKRINSTIKIEGYRGTEERELVFDANTWELLKDEVSPNEGPDDDDDDDQSGDDDDQDDDDRDDEDDDDDDEDDDEDDDDDDDDDDDNSGKGSSKKP